MTFLFVNSNILIRSEACCKDQIDPIVGTIVDICKHANLPKGLIVDCKRNQQYSYYNPANETIMLCVRFGQTPVEIIKDLMRALGVEEADYVFVE